jgi:hypothetical protein
MAGCLGFEPRLTVSESPLSAAISWNYLAGIDVATCTDVARHYPEAGKRETGRRGGIVRDAAPTTNRRHCYV